MHALRIQPAIVKIQQKLRLAMFFFVGHTYSFMVPIDVVHYIRVYCKCITDIRIILEGTTDWVLEIHILVTLNHCDQFGQNRERHSILLQH